MSDNNDAFADRVAAVKVPEPNADREALLMKVGVGLAVLGGIVLAVGWFGASGTANVYEQVPYVISGGAGGLGLIVLGSALITRYSLARLFRFWLLRTLHEHEVQTDRTVAALERVEAALGDRRTSPLD